MAKNEPRSTVDPNFKRRSHGQYSIVFDIDECEHDYKNKNFIV